MRYAIVLGGGRSARMGTNKMAVKLGDRTLLERTVQAALSWADTVIVAAPKPEDWRDDKNVHFTLEDPPYGGPVAGIKAAAALMDTAGETLVLAGDLAAPDSVVTALSSAAATYEHATYRQSQKHDPSEPPVPSEARVDAIVLEDEQGWPQYLAGYYRVDVVKDALALLGKETDTSVRRLFRHVPVQRVPALRHVTQDLDTPEDLRRTLYPHDH